MSERATAQIFGLSMTIAFVGMLVLNAIFLLDAITYG